MEIIYGNQMFVMALWMIRCHNSQFIRAKCRLTIATANETWKCEIVRSLKKKRKFSFIIKQFFFWVEIAENENVDMNWSFALCVFFDVIDK